MNLLTVTGLIPVNDIHLADGHKHVWINPPEGIAPEAKIALNDPVRVQRELEDFKAAGGSLLVDCQPGGS